jgi:hypothetical protein
MQIISDPNVMRQKKTTRKKSYGGNNYNKTIAKLSYPCVISIQNTQLGISLIKRGLATSVISG